MSSSIPGLPPQPPPPSGTAAGAEAALASPLTWSAVMGASGLGGLAPAAASGTSRAVPVLAVAGYGLAAALYHREQDIQGHFTGFGVCFCSLLCRSRPRWRRR